MNKLLIFTYLVLVFFVTGQAGTVQVYEMKCENLVNPLAIDKTVPRFSWKVKSGRNGAKQVAYQVMVASDEKLLSEDKPDLWNSRKVPSSESIWVKYHGKALNPGNLVFWKVRVWDELGNVSDWSKPAFLGIGLLNFSDWKASYIAFPTERKFDECPVIKKITSIKKGNGRYLLHVNSLGYHEVYVNGEKTGYQALTPAVSQFDRRSLINTYDITDQLIDGENTIALWLGSGWYSENLPGVTQQGPVVRAQLTEVKGIKSKTILSTDQTWFGSPGRYSRQGSWQPNRFGGETVDGSFAVDELGNSVEGWKNAVLVKVPVHNATPQMAEPNYIFETLNPVEIWQTSKDTFMVDFGKSVTGWVEIDFPELEKGKMVSIGYCDHLRENRKFNDRQQTDYFISGQGKKQTFCNKFNYHGFRYIRVAGLHGALTTNSVRAHLIHTGYRISSGFRCSDEEINRIHNMVQYTLRCLSLGGYLVDCPQIERLGYGGDGNASTPTFQTMFDVSGLYDNWLQAWADCIRPDGGMPHTAPNPYKAGGGPYWCGFIITAGWNTFLNYGDTLLLRKNYPVMEKWLDYVAAYSVNGLLKKWPDTDYRGWYLGDWAVPDGVDQKNYSSVDLVNNCYIVTCFDRMEKISKVLGEKEKASAYQSKRDKLKKLVHSCFFNGKNGYATLSQVDLAFPLLADVTPPELQDIVKESLVFETEVNRKGHFATGLVGIPVLTDWVTKNKASELMYTMLKQHSYPGYLYMIDNGATTTWEHWNGERSQIHNCYNGIGTWFYQALAGIKVADGSSSYRHIIIEPQVVKGIEWVEAWKETPFGKVSVFWKKSPGTMQIQTSVPVGSRATIMLWGFREKGKVLVNQVETKPSAANGAIELESGNYEIRYDTIN